MTVSELRRNVRQTFPHVTIKVRTVSFVDLARASRQALTITGDRSAAEVETINGWAREAGILPDGNIRFYHQES